VKKKRKNRLEFRFASKQKLLNRSEVKTLKRKKAKKNRLEIRFALFRFEAKSTQVKRSEKFDAKISEKKRKKRSEILK